jgi:hypothetical protein
MYAGSRRSQGYLAHLFVRKYHRCTNGTPSTSISGGLYPKEGGSEGPHTLCVAASGFMYSFGTIAHHLQHSFSRYVTQCCKVPVIKACLQILPIKLERSGSLGTNFFRESYLLFAKATFEHPFFLMLCFAATASAHRPETHAESRLCLPTHAGRPKTTPSSRAELFQLSAPTYTPPPVAKTGGCGHGAAAPTMDGAGLNDS